MIDWDEIRRAYESSELSMTTLAEQYSVNVSTLRSRKNRESWQRNADATQRENVATRPAEKKPAKKKATTKEPDTDPAIDLTEKQRLFCIYYLKYFNATKAYRKAYGCAYSTAMVNGSQLLRKTKVAAEIDRLKEEQTTEIKLSIQDLIQKYIDIAFADITDYTEFGQKSYKVERIVDIDPDTGQVIKQLEDQHYSYVDLKDHTEVDGTIITEVKQGRDGVTVKLADRMKALEMLTKYYDFLPENAKRQLEEEKLKLEIEELKEDPEGDEDEVDDGFLAALESEGEELWPEE